jgi:hypothetical protein
MSPRREEAGFPHEQECDMIPGKWLPLQQSFSPDCGHFCENPLLYFLRCREQHPAFAGVTALTALRFGAVHEISFPHRHH